MAGPRGHFKRGASGADKWGNCPGSIEAEEGIEDHTTFFAAEGTAFHEWAADCLELGLEPEDLYGLKVKVQSGWIEDEDGNPVFVSAAEIDEETGDIIPPEMLPDHYEFVFDESFGKHMRGGLARIWELVGDGQLFVETEVDISPWVGKGGFSTADVTIVNVALRRLILWDWKYGVGYGVSPIENWQLMIYLLGAWNTFARAMFEAEGIEPEDIEVVLIIEQPRNSDGGGEWSTTMDKVLEWGEFIRERADASYEIDAPRIPGEKQCRWCKAKPYCREHSDWLLKMAQLSFEELEFEMETDIAPPLPNVHVLTAEQRAFIHRNEKLFRDWLSEIQRSLLIDFMRGDETPGLKVVEGNKGHRAWIKGSEKEVKRALIKRLGRKAFAPRKLITPTQAEDLLGKKEYANLTSYVSQADGKPALVSESHSRPAMERLIDKFDNLDAIESEEE